MKKQHQWFKKSVTVVTVLLTLKNAILAQNYFAGAGAGAGNTGTGVTAVGAVALNSSNSGAYVSAFGYAALKSNTSGASNTAFGAGTLYSNTTGSYNTAIGHNTLFYNTTGSRNTSFGYNALQSNTTGTSNCAIGDVALFKNTTGNFNIAIGTTALYQNTTGNRNIAIGLQALINNSTGSDNIAAGENALANNTTGLGNIATGKNALLSNTTGQFNVAYGFSALEKNTTGSGNIAIGDFALTSSIGAGNTGSYNVAVGSSALSINTTGNNNTAMGAGTLSSNTTGFSNSAVGQYALISNQTGTNNSGVGKYALGGNRTGSYNTGVGDSTGWQFTVYDNCTFLGRNTDATITGLKNATAIGNGARVNASNKVVVGNTAITSIGGQVGWTTFSDLNLKTNINKSKLGLHFILQLNPVTYNYKAEGQKDILYTGLIAQEVDAAAKKTGMAFSGVDKTGEHWGIRYAELTVPIIKAVQEQNETVTALQEENRQLQLRIEKLEKAFAALQGGNSDAAKTNTSALFQNSPNPYTNTTTIKYALAKEVTQAQLIIRNSAGATVKTITLNGMGTGHAVINAKEMAAGIYTCSLYTNGQLADTKMLAQTR